MNDPRRLILALALLLFPPAVRAGDLDFSDPARLPPPPAGAAGYPNRAADADALPGFVTPPPGYGEVGFYWWLGDPLTKERLTWQLDQLQGKGVAGLQVNYAHSDHGGQSYGLTIPSDPPLFSAAWWDLYGWFLQEAKKRGMAVSLSDYTLGVGQGWYMDELLAENPDVAGAVLTHMVRNHPGGTQLQWELPANTVSLMAYRVKQGAIEPGSGVDLLPTALQGTVPFSASAARTDDKRDSPPRAGGTLRWTAPEGSWQVVAVAFNVHPNSVNPMHPSSGKKLIEKFFQRFEDRNPGEAGKGLNFFFSDELSFGVSGKLWDSRFAAEFQKRKGYDLVPELPALFVDIGPRTPKVRLDYSDVLVSLEEENYFRPLFDWHYKRGMLYGSDHGGRGHNVVEFGDYFRAQRWMTGTGNDQPRLGANINRTKVNASIVHLYERPRTWLEGFYGSGWGTTPAQLVDATFRNFAHGSTLLTLHGLYYSTHGGWWEWAPPCNHYHMPYWSHMGTFLHCAERMAYLLSQGHHCCDVAILYPVAPMEAGMGGQEAVQAAFGLGAHLYNQGLDFDFIDFESVARAKVQDKQLQVSGERYRVLILPAMRAVRHSTLVKAAEFKQAGGIVLAVDALPEASERTGRDDPELAAIVRELFGTAAISDAKQVEKTINQAFTRDFQLLSGADPKVQPQVNHRHVGPRDVYLVYAAPKGAECFFRATGKVELWDPWTGGTRPLAVVSQTSAGTRLRMPLDAAEAQLIVFSPGTPQTDQGAATPQPAVATVEGDWEFELKPALDNRFGDYRWPPTPTLIGAEARQIRYAEETASSPGWQDPKLDDSKWPKVTCSFGPKFWKLGPLPANIDTKELEGCLATLDHVDPAVAVVVDGKKYPWQPYCFSWRWGIEDDPGHQGYHGLKTEVHDEFIALGKVKRAMTGSTYTDEPGGSRYYLWTAAVADGDTAAGALVGGQKPAAAWLNHVRCEKLPCKVQLKAGANPVLLRYDRPGRVYFVLDTSQTEVQDEPAPAAKDSPFSPEAAWIWSPGDQRTCNRVFRRTFDVTELPHRASLRITCDNAYTVFLNDREIGHGNDWQRVQEYTVTEALTRGKNVIAVAARNTGQSAGLIAELTLDRAGGVAHHVATDATWHWAQTEQPGWRTAVFDDSRWQAVERLSAFAGSLWATHPLGPPRLDGAAVASVKPKDRNSPRLSGAGQGARAAEAVVQPVFKLSPLAMTWHNRPEIVAFDLRPQVARPAGWYRFLSPPGFRGMMIPTKGNVRAWAHGREMTLHLTAAGVKAVVAEPQAAPLLVAVRIEQERGCYGGAALSDPILLDCVAGTNALGDWSQIDGLASYSGGAWYRKTITLAPEQTRGRTVLNLGNVAASAEVRVNGRPAGIRVAPPWTLDISDWVNPGENRIEVLVYNTLANHYSTIPTRYRGVPTSGLLGPVVIETWPTP